MKDTIDGINEKAWDRAMVGTKPALRAVQLSAADRQTIVEGLDSLDESIIEARSIMIRRNAEALAIDQFTSALERIGVLRKRLQ